MRNKEIQNLEEKSKKNASKVKMSTSISLWRNKKRFAKKSINRKSKSKSIKQNCDDNINLSGGTSNILQKRKQKVK